MLTYLYLNLDPDSVYNSFTTKQFPPKGKESRKLKPTVKCSKYYNTSLYKFGKDKNSNQKYLCKKCRRQFTLQSTKKHSLGYPRW
ncbi:IS1/IS1595 family N-terminal zinc-binding domain-containing protein [Romboutsia maritimum]